MLRRLVILSVVCAAAALTSPVRSADPALLGAVALSWEEILAKVPEGKRAAQVFRDPTATFDQLELHVTFLPVGQASHVPPHSHPHEEILILKEGTLDALVGAQTRRLGPGSVIFWASNVPHTVKNVGTTTAVYHIINVHPPGTLKDATKN